MCSVKTLSEELQIESSLFDESSPVASRFTTCTQSVTPSSVQDCVSVTPARLYRQVCTITPKTKMPL